MAIPKIEMIRSKESCVVVLRWPDGLHGRALSFVGKQARPQTTTEMRFASLRFSCANSQEKWNQAVSKS
jgi:hypothetical protein